MVVSIDEKRFRTLRGGTSYIKTVQIITPQKHENTSRGEREKSVEKGYHNTRAEKKKSKKKSQWSSE